MPKVECICVICSNNFHAWPCRKNSKTCSKECLYTYRSKNLHKGNFKKGEHPSKNTEFKKGMIRELAPSWKGGKINNGSGYIKTYKSNKSIKKTYEHRLIMEAYIGRPLSSKEIVHHIDGNRSNNDISNLMLFKNHSEHRIHHVNLQKLKNK